MESEKNVNKEMSAKVDRALTDLYNLGLCHTYVDHSDNGDAVMFYSTRTEFNYNATMTALECFRYAEAFETIGKYIQEKRTKAE